MIRKIVVLAIMPLLLALMGYGGRMVMEHSWDELVNYQSPYTSALPSGKGGAAVTDQVIIILQDGLRLDASRELETWNRLRAQGADLTVHLGQPSLSIPSFTVINTGAYQEINGVTTNWYEEPLPPLDSIFCEAKKKGLTTAIVREAGGPELFGQCLDYALYSEMSDDPKAADDVILEESLSLLEKKPNLLWIHFSGSDWAGHNQGGASQEYREFAREIDSRIAKILAAIDLKSAVVILLADHGHIDSGGHGGGEEEVIRVPLVIAGESIKPGSYAEVEQVNIAPTVATLLGMAIPTHSQGQPLFDVLDMTLQSKADRAVDVARQHQVFYRQYLSVIGASGYLDTELSEAYAALAAGDHEGAYQRATSYTEGIRQYTEQAKDAKLWRERVWRLPIALLILVIPGAYLAFYRKKAELVVPLIGAVVYFVVYDGYFFLRGFKWSLSVFNDESMITGFIILRIVEAAISLLIAAVLVGVLMRRRSIFETAKAAVNTSFFVGFGLLLQVDLYFWLYSLDIDWYLPNLQWGFKYYLDLLQVFATGIAALVAPFVAIGARAIASRIPAVKAS